MAEAWRSAPLATEEPPPPPMPSVAPVVAETQAGAVTGRAQPRRPRASQEPSFQEAWRSAPVVETTPGEKASAFGRSAVGGLVESAATAGGAVAGGSFGALSRTPAGTAAGASIGAGAGHELGQAGKRALTTAGVAIAPEELPPELRPYGYAGELIGAAGPIALMPGIGAATGFRTGGFLDRIIEFAGRNPRTFLASEAAGAGSAAVAGAVSESHLPGQALPRVGAEVVGGFFNPSRLLIGASKSAADAVRMAVSSMSQSGREARAAEVLQDIVLKAGEDPAALAKLLRESGMVNVTAAQKTGSPALIALETRLSQESAKFGADARRMADDGLSVMRDAIAALRGTGEPAAVRAAAELQDRYFRTVIAGRIQAAERSAVEAAGRITTDQPQSRALLARQAHELLEEAVRDARKVESELWEAVPKDVKATADGIVGRFREYRNQMLPEESMPAIVEGFVERMQRDGATTSGELIRFRSRALALAREASAQGKANDARIYGGLAEAALDDLDRLARPTMGSDFAGVPSMFQGLDEARAFSRAFNETFGRTFAGDAMATTARGGDRIPPELMLRRAFGAGREAGQLRLRELEDAMRFLPDKSLGGPQAQANLNFMLDAQERILRLSAAEAIDPFNGRVSATRLTRFIDANAGLLDRFPEVRTTLQQAVRTEVGAQHVQQIAEGAKGLVARQAAFSRVLKHDSASDAVKKALAGDRPESEIVALARLAKGRGGGTDAVEGLKAAIWEDAVRRSTDAAGNLSFERLSTALFTELRPGLPPLANVLQKEGILTTADIAKAQAFIKQAETIQSALERGTNLEKLMQNPDALFDLVLRVAGAKLGSAMNAAGPGGGGSSLIAASRGSSFARQVFDKVPQGRVRDVLIQAAMDPKFMALLLEKPKSPTEGIRVARQIHAYIVQAGLTGPESQ